MIEASEWSMHLTIGKGGHPEFAWLTRDDDVMGCCWVADQEFGPFDGLLDVYRWLAGVLRRNGRSAPG